MNYELTGLRFVWGDSSKLTKELDKHTTLNPATGKRTPKSAAAPEAPKTKAQALFQGQRHPKKQKKVPRLEQWIEVTIEDGKTVTTLYPPNQQLIEEGQRMLPPPEMVYRRINFVDGVPSEYEWIDNLTDDLRRLGGCCVQRMTINTWLETIELDEALGTGHLGPLPVNILPRPNGECDCEACQHAQALLDKREAIARERGLPTDLDSLLRMTN